jgi:hypothetical protein
LGPAPIASGRAATATVPVNDGLLQEVSSPVLAPRYECRKLHKSDGHITTASCDDPVAWDVLGASSYTISVLSSKLPVWLV